MNKPHAFYALPVYWKKEERVMNHIFKKFRGFLALLLLLVTLAGFGGAALAENSPVRLRGNAARFGLQGGRLMLPDCLLLDVKAPYTTWELNSRPTAQEMQSLFDALGRAEAVPCTPVSKGRHARYAYAGLRLKLQSTRNPAATAVLTLRPLNYKGLGRYSQGVDIYVDLYENRGKQNEKCERHALRLKAGKTWEQIVRLSGESVALEALKSTTAIEYHSMRSGASAPASPDKTPRTLRDQAHIRAITGVLLGGKRVPLTAASDVLHLRFRLGDGSVRNVYLQRPASQNQQASGLVYARVGAECYEIDSGELYKVLRNAGCPDPMFRA